MDFKQSDFNNEFNWKLYKNAEILGFITIVGTLAPVITVGSVLLGTIESNHIDSLKYGYAANIYELLIFIVMTIPLSILSMLLILRKSVSVYYYFASWTLLCLSPVTLSGYDIGSQYFLMELFFNMGIGAVIVVYLLKSDSVAKYLR